MRAPERYLQVIFPGGDCAIYLAESVKWDRRAGTLTLERPGHSVLDHWGADIQVTAWRWVDGSMGRFGIGHGE